MKKWKSKALWPTGTLVAKQDRETTEDTHDTREQASGVCDLLEANGFGGEGRIFPVETWIEEA